MIRNPAAAADPTVCFSQRPQCTCLTSFGTRSTMLLISCMTLSHCQQFTPLPSSQVQKAASFSGGVALHSHCSADVVLAEAACSRLQIKSHIHTHTHGLIHAPKSQLWQAGLTLRDSRAGKQLLALTLISTVRPLTDDFSVCCFASVYVHVRMEGDKDLRVRYRACVLVTYWAPKSTLTFY